MAVYEAIIATPRKEPTNEVEYMALIDDMTRVGYLDSTMGSHGYSFELIVSNNVNERELDAQLRDIVNYHGLTLVDLYFISY